MVSISFFLSGQKTILDDPELLKIIKEGVTYIYNCEFPDAKKIHREILKQRPLHPVSPFYNGIMIYWENYPLTPFNKKVDIFIERMYETIEKSKLLLEKDENDTEGVFFDLVAKGMLMMYYADNDIPAKTIKIAPSAYRHVIKGFDLKEKFKEFYFTTGLYNYYIEAYPEKHPVYKPLKLFFRGGDKELGLEQLKICREETVFMTVEASLFLALIYYNFENDIKTALGFIEKLYLDYPNNPYFLSKYIEFLLLTEDYENAKTYLKQLIKGNRHNRYVVMKGIIFKGIIEEKNNNNLEKARKNYKLGIKIAKEFGPRASEFVSFAYYGLSRVAGIEGDEKERKEFRKLAKAHSKYDHFSDVE